MVRSHVELTNVSLDASRSSTPRGSRSTGAPVTATPTPGRRLSAAPPNTPSSASFGGDKQAAAGVIPWRVRVTKLQEEIALALAASQSPMDAEARRNEVRARHWLRHAQLFRGFAAFYYKAARSLEG